MSKKADKLRDMTVPELDVVLSDLNKELYELVNQQRREKKLEKPHLLRLKRKDKARLLTIMHEKQTISS